MFLLLIINLINPSNEKLVLIMFKKKLINEKENNSINVGSIVTSNNT